MTSICRPKFVVLCALGVLVTLGTAQADPHPAETEQVHDKHGSAAEVGRKLSDPTSNVWALFTEFDLTFSDGDLNRGDDRIGGQMIFQPIMPFPLYGEGKDQWKMITRPTIPLVFSTSVPRRSNEFSNVGGFGDSTLPMPISPPAGNWILGLGPTFLFPTATRDELGKDQFAIGPTGIFGHKTKDYTLGVFPQYYWKVGSTGGQGGRRAINQMNLLYFGFLNLQNAWQIGFNPTITYDRRQERENRWNVPVGLLVTKTMAINGRPMKFQFGMEYSVVHQDDFGKRFLMKFNVIPVIPGLVENPIFGGG